MGQGTTPRRADLVVDSPDSLTEVWFTAVLRDGGVLAEHATVTSARSELIGTGQVGIVVRSELSYEDVDDDAAPASVIVKIASENPTSRQIGVLMGLYDSECRFYDEIAPMIDAAVPRSFWGGFDSETGRVTLVLEDLTPVAEVGDDTARDCPPARAEAAFAQLVRLQAPVWNSPDLKSLGWLGGRDRAQLFFDAVAPAITPFKEAFADRLDADHLELIDRVAPKASEWPRRALVDPLVVTHGDFRLDNLMFSTRAGVPEVTIIDWQTCRLGPPLLDHTILLINSMTSDDRRSHERDLLRTYHEQLVAAGVRDFTFEDCLESYRRSSLYPFLMAVALSLAVAHSDRARDIAAQTFRGAADLVRELGADRLLD